VRGEPEFNAVGSMRGQYEEHEVDVGESDGCEMNHK
jgi:hypothetical protein